MFFFNILHRWQEKLKNSIKIWKKGVALQNILKIFSKSFFWYKKASYFLKRFLDVQTFMLIFFCILKKFGEKFYFRKNNSTCHENCFVYIKCIFLNKNFKQPPKFKSEKYLSPDFLKKKIVAKKFCDSKCRTCLIWYGFDF